MAKPQYQRSSGNIYKDLGFPNSEEMQAKADLASSILSIIDKRKWTQQEAAEILKTTQSKVSLLARGQFSGFSVERLIKFLNRLNQDVEIVIRDRAFSKSHMGHVSVVHTSAHA